MSLHWAGYTKEIPASNRWLQAAFTCDFCSGLSVASSGHRITDSEGYPTNMVNLRSDDAWTWHPRTGDSPEFPDVPEHVTNAAKEAHASASIGAPMAAILMARTVVEASAKHFGVEEGNLPVKIDGLRDKNLIRPGIADAAHEIRYLGNNMAHGDIDDKPSAEDAADVLQLMDQLLNELFQGPALVARIRAKREQ